MNEKKIQTDYEVKVTKWYFDFVVFNEHSDGSLTPFHRPYFVEVEEDPFIGDTWVYKRIGTTKTFYGTYDQFKQFLISDEEHTPVFANEIKVCIYYKTRRYTYKYDPSAPTSKDLDSKLKAMNSIVDSKGKKITKEELQKLTN